MELYTSLVRLKQAMNGGQVPPMTPIPTSVQDIIDPEFTIGLGAVAEDAEKGLRCPVRGCGRWCHDLGAHIGLKHRAIGGVLRVRRALSLPRKAPLLSHSLRDKRDALPKRQYSSEYMAMVRSHRKQDAMVRRSASLRSNGDSMGLKNLRNVCVAQLSHRILDLHNELGHSPTYDEFVEKYGNGIMQEVKNTFGSWSSAKAQVGMKVYCGTSVMARKNATRISRNAVLEALAAWHERNGDLPTVTDAVGMERSPFLPDHRTIVSKMNAASWRNAMEIAASVLNIYGGRYGLPVKQESAA